MGLLPDYSRQARTYDRTRAASPSVLLPLRAALQGAPGPCLADIGGGTGNYALALKEQGWEPVVIDRSPEMLTRAREKGLATITADAQHLPLANESFDAVMLVSMLHHVDDQESVLAEARRILRRKGRLALMVYTREDIEDLWLLDLFPSTRAWMHNTHPALSQLLALLPGAQRHPVVFSDLQDASLAALASHPEKLLDERWRAQTSYFERLQREHPHELNTGLQRLAHQIADGGAPARPGRASILAWQKPTDAPHANRPPGDARQSLTRRNSRHDYADQPTAIPASSALVILITTAARALGPAVSGVMTPFSIAASVLAAFTLAHDGPAVSLAMLRGFVAALPGFAAFFFAVALVLG